MRARRAFIVVLLALFGAGSLRAQSYIGTYYSFYRSGASYSKVIDEDAFWEVTLGVDYGNSVLRQSRACGVVAVYTYDFVLKDWQHPGGAESRLFAGPSVTLGMTKDDHYGLVMGLSAVVGYEYEFDFPLSLGIGVLPVLAAHICNDGGSGTQMELYKNGLRWSLCPQISIKYNLGGVTSVRSAFHPTKSTYLAGGERARRFTYGFEWAYSAMFLRIKHHNYILSTGRVDDRSCCLDYINNGLALAHVGLNCGKHLNMSIYGGYGSIYYEERAFPLTLRGTWFFGQEPSSSRWFMLLDGGCAFRNGSTTAALGKLGGGYRVSLTRSVKLDFALAYQFTYAELEMYDDEGNLLSSGRIRRNDNYLNSVNLSIGITL